MKLLLALLCLFTQIEEKQKELDELKGKLTAVRSEIQHLEKQKIGTLARIEKIDEGMTLTIKYIDELSAQESKEKERIKELDREIARLESKMNLRKDDLRERLLRLYKWRPFYKLEILLSSKSLPEILSSSYYLQILAHDDQKAFFEFKSDWEKYQTDKTIMGVGKLHREVVLQYAWREDVQLQGGQFGSLEGELVPLLCGGTLVFDGRGNVRSWIRKPGASTQRVLKATRRRAYCQQEQEKGKEREKQLLRYLASRVAGGYVGLFEGAIVVHESHVVVASQCPVGFWEIGLKLECSVNRCLRLGEPLVGTIESPKVQLAVGFAESNEGHGKAGIQLRRLPEHHLRLAKILLFRSRSSEVLESPEIDLVGKEVLRRLRFQCLTFRLQQCDIELLDDVIGDLCLDGEYVFEGAVVPLGPEMRVV